MKEILGKPNGAQTPEETEQAVADLAARLEEMDRAEGVFGEVMDKEVSDEELDEVTGGMAHIVPTSCPPEHKQSIPEVWRE